MKLTFREVIGSSVLSGRQSKTEAAIDDAGSGSIWLGVILGAVGAMLYSMKAIFVKLAYLPGGGLEVGELPPITLMMLRMGFSFPFYVIILWWALSRADPKPKAKHIGLAAAAGVLAYYVCTFLDFTGLQYITAQLERLLLFTYPAFVIIFGVLFFGGRVSKWGVLAVLLSYAGLAIVFAAGDIAIGSNVLLGSSLIIATAILFALFQLFAKHFIDKMGAKLFTCIAMIGAASAIFTHFFIQAVTHDGIGAALDLPPRIYVLGAVIAVFSTILPSFFINYAIGRIGAQRVAMLGMVGPLATIVAAIMFLGEPFGIWDFIGTVLTITGIALYMRFDRAQTPSKPKPLAR